MHSSAGCLVEKAHFCARSARREIEDLHFLHAEREEEEIVFDLKVRTLGDSECGKLGNLSLVCLRLCRVFVSVFVFVFVVVFALSLNSFVFEPGSDSS